MGLKGISLPGETSKKTPKLCQKPNGDGHGFCLLFWGHQHGALANCHDTSGLHRLSIHPQKSAMDGRTQAVMWFHAVGLGPLQAAVLCRVQRLRKTKPGTDWQQERCGHLARKRAPGIIKRPIYFLLVGLDSSSFIRGASSNV